MRSLLAGIITLLFVSLASGAPSPPTDLTSTDAVLRWINAYRAKPDPKGVPLAMRALSRLGALTDPERAGVYLGFLAGILGSNPDKAETIISETLAMRPDDHWIIVRAIAYSGMPNWKQLLVKFKARIPARRAMIDKYLVGKVPRSISW